MAQALEIIDFFNDFTHLDKFKKTNAAHCHAEGRPFEPGYPLH